MELRPPFSSLMEGCRVLLVISFPLGRPRLASARLTNAVSFVVSPLGPAGFYCLPLGQGGNASFAQGGRRKIVKMKPNAPCCVPVSGAAENMRMALPIRRLFPLLRSGLKWSTGTFRELTQWSRPGRVLCK